MTVDRHSSWILYCLIGLWILAGLQIANMAIHPFLSATDFDTVVKNHWDFRVYLAAHDVYRLGGNPLDLSQLRLHGVDIPYNYSPAFTRATMWFFDGNPQTVEYRFIGVKILAILTGFGALVKGFRLKGAWIPIAAFMTTFGFGSGLLVDMAAGNITAVEFLWVSLVAIGAYRRWDLMFLAGLFLLCLGKPIWGIFAAVPVLLYWDRRAWRTFGFACGAFLLPLLLSAGISGAETKQYLRSSFGFREVGWINPCLREFITEAMSFMGVGGRTATLTWAASSLGTVAGVGWMRSRLKGDFGLAFGASAMLLLPCILPRFKPYAYGLLIPFLLLALTVRPPDATTLRRVLLLATAPFIAWLTLAFVGSLDGYNYGFLHILGYFSLALALATFGLVNPQPIAALVRGADRFLIKLRPFKLVALAGLTLWIAVAMIKGATAYRGAVSAKLINSFSDIATYSRVAREMAMGHVPYRDFGFEYPPVSAYYLALPAPHGDFDRIAYFNRFTVFSGLLCAIGLVAFALLSYRRVGLRRTAGFTLAAMFALGVARELTFVRFDAPVALLATCGGLLLLESWGRWTSAAGSFFISFAAGLKMYPVILLAALWRTIPKTGRPSAWAGLILGLLPTLALLLIGRHGVATFVDYHTSRHIEMGSFWATVSRPFVAWHIGIDFGSAECRFNGERIVLVLSSLATVVATFLPLFRLKTARTGEQALRIGIVALYGFVFFNKVGSPQYAMWLLGATLIGIGGPSRRAWTTLGVSVAGVLSASDSMSVWNVNYPAPLVAFANVKILVLGVGYLTAIWAMRDAFANGLVRPDDRSLIPADV